MRVDIRAEAEIELEEAFDYYNECRAGLGDIFLDEYLHAIREIAASPHRWPREPSDEEFHRYRLNRFPFKLIYAIEPDHCMIYAVANQHREPGYWRDRI